MPFRLRFPFSNRNLRGGLPSIVGGFALDGYYGVKQHAYDRKLVGLGNRKGKVNETL